MEKFKMYFSVACTSFTILILAFTILSFWDITGPVNAMTVLVLLGINIIIAIALSFTDKISVSAQLARSAIDMAVILGVVLGIGIPTNIIPPSLQNITLAIALALIVYLGTYFVMIMKAKSDVDEINATIRNIKAARDTIEREEDEHND